MDQVDSSQQMGKVENNLKEAKDIGKNNKPKRRLMTERLMKLYLTIFKRTVTSATTRTPFCKHQIASCFMHSLEGFLKDFFIGAFVKGGITLLLGLLKPKKGLFGAFKNIFSSDTAMFALFTGTFLAIYRLTLCKLRAFRGKDDKYNSMIAGFLASLTLAFDNSKSRRITVAIYSFARSLESVIKVLDHNDIIRERKLWPVFLLNILHIYIAVTWYFDIDGFPPGLNKPIEKITGAKENDYIIIERVCRVMYSSEKR
ncbi:unnamed protein product [Moneuplotes crassus]|uniref:Peroxisomal membrane protein 4 n=2 Tax=Euplotes crassus TaxID=5936 RepID=A0AAD2D3F6_EUPCR|nr:unnamed protein product [Moneuplotes crassus]